MKQCTGPELESTLEGLSRDGFLVTAAVTNSVPYTVVGVKVVGANLGAANDFQQATGPDLRSTLSSMGAQGYFVTSLTANSVPYTAFGAKSLEN